MTDKKRQSKKNALFDALPWVAVYFVIIFILSKAEIINAKSTGWVVYLGIAIIIIVFKELSKFLMKNRY